MAMLACARLGAVHSVVFGGFAAAELATRISDAQPKVIVSASCGIEVTRVIAYKPLLDRAIDLADAQAGALPDRAAAAGARGAGPRPGPGLGVGRGGGRAGGLRAGPRHRPALHPLHLRHDREAEGRRPRQRRARGRAALVDDVGLRHRPRRGVLGRQRRRLGRRPLLHRLRAAAGRLHHGPVRGQAGRHAGRRRVLAGDRRARGAGAVHRADRVPGDPQGGPDRRARWPSTTCPGCGRCSWPASGSTRRPTGGPASCSASRWSTTGGRPRPAGRSRPNPLGLEALPAKAGLADRADAGLGRAGARPGRRAGAGRTWTARWSIRLPLPPGALPTLWRDDERFVSSYLSRYPGYYLTGDGGHVDADGYLFVMGRIDDVINVAGHRLSTGAMEEVLAGHPAVAECAVIGVADALKGQVPRGFVVLKAGVSTDPDGGRGRAGAAGPGRDRRGGGAAPGRRGRRRCRRPGRARSCAGRCGRSPTGSTQPVPSTIEDPAVLDALRPTLRS